MDNSYTSNVEAMSTHPVDSGSQPLSIDISVNLRHMRDIFHNCKDLSILPWRYGPDMQHSAFSIYFESLIPDKKANYMKESLQDLVTYEVGPAASITPEQIIHFFSRNGVTSQTGSLVYHLEGRGLRPYHSREPCHLY